MAGRPPVTAHPALAFLLPVLALLAAVGAHGAQQRQARRRADGQQAAKRAQARAQHLRENPVLVIRMVLRRMGVPLADIDARIAWAKQRLEQAVKSLRETPATPWQGLNLLVRIVLSAVFAATVIGAGILNVEVFVAVNAGVPDLAAVIKGLVATAAEASLAAVLVELYRGRKPSELAWKAQFAVVVSLLVLVVGLVSSYAGARSDVRYAPREKQAGIVLTAAQEKAKEQPTPVSVTAVNSATADLVQIRDARRNAERSDQALAVVLPLVEASTGAYALEGLLALNLLALAGTRRLEVRRYQKEIHQATRERDALRARAELEAEQELQAAGVTNISEAPPLAPAATGLPGSRANGAGDGRRGPARPDHPTAPDLDLGRFPGPASGASTGPGTATPPPTASPGHTDTSRWDLA